MVNAVVLLQVEPKKINDVAQALVGMEHVTEVYSVGGRFDIVAIIRARDNEAVSDTVTSKFLAVEGIKASETLIAFRTYSRHDLERLFSIGG